MGGSYIKVLLGKVPRGGDDIAQKLKLLRTETSNCLGLEG